MSPSTESQDPTMTRSQTAGPRTGRESSRETQRRETRPERQKSRTAAESTRSIQPTSRDPPGHRQRRRPQEAKAKEAPKTDKNHPERGTDEAGEQDSKAKSVIDSRFSLPNHLFCGACLLIPSLFLFPLGFSIIVIQL